MFLGTNKSGALKKVLEVFEKFEISNPSKSQFESGTLEGLMTDLKGNNNTMVGIFDEFSTFKDSLDKGTSGSSEKGRFLSLFNASKWSKSTKSCGSMILIDPRFNLISYTQPYYACNFARNNTSDGFFQRFLMTLPKEEFVEVEDKEKKIENEADGLIDFSNIFGKIYQYCTEGQRYLSLNDDAYNLYKLYHNEIVDYRKKDLFEESRVSLKSKSVGIMLRLSGILCYLRKAVSGNFSQKVNEDDVLRATNIIRYSNAVSFALINENYKPISTNRPTKIPLPKPENITLDFLIPYSNTVKKLFRVYSYV